MKILRNTLWASVGLFGLVTLLAMPAAADFVINDDLIVDGSACIGFDCVNGESFGFDTIRIKENNLRIRADDTSNSASFPDNDWQLLFNDSSNGGLERFSVEDISGGRIPFTIEAGARSNALYVESDGDLGIGTNNPVGDVHIVTGNTPTLRLEQDGSSGFTPQTWDLAGNETNFFIRDATNGSTLPFRIRPSAPTSSIDIEGSTGDVGFGTSSPSEPIHVRRTDATATNMLIENANASGQIVALQMDNTATLPWDFRLAANGSFAISLQGSGANEISIAQNGNVTIARDLIITGQCSEVDGPCAPDYVFEPDYNLPTLPELSAFITENKHLPNVPSADKIESGGINMRRFNFAMLEKIEELVLYTLEQQNTIDALTTRLEALETKRE